MTKKQSTANRFALITAASHFVFASVASASSGSPTDNDALIEFQYESPASSSTPAPSAQSNLTLAELTEFNMEAVWLASRDLTNLWQTSEFLEKKEKCKTEYNQVSEKYNKFYEVFDVLYDVTENSDGSISSITLKPGLQNIVGISDVLQKLGMPFDSSADAVGKYLSDLYDLHIEEVSKNCQLEQELQSLRDKINAIKSQVTDLTSRNAALTSSNAALTSSNAALTSSLEQMAKKTQPTYQINNHDGDLEAGISQVSQETSRLLGDPQSLKNPSKWRPIFTHLAAGFTGAGLTAAGFFIYFFFGR